MVFNIGDCHAVLSTNGVAADMSDAHKPNRPDEAARIIAARGKDECGGMWLNW